MTEATDGMEPCPHCGESIATIARKCKHCGEFREGTVRTVDPAAGMAMSFALGTVLVALICVVSGVGAAIVGPNTVKLRQQSNEREAIESLRRIVDAEEAYQAQDLGEDGRKVFGTLGQLGSAQLLDPDLASGLRRQYVFEVGVSGPFPSKRWMAIASPIKADSGRFFVTNHTGAIYYRLNHPFVLDLNTCELPPDALPVGAEQLR